QNLGRRRLWRRVGELLAVGENVLKLDVRVEVLEQDPRRGGPLERPRRMRDEKKRRNEREAGSPVHAASATTWGSRRRGLRRARPERALHHHGIRPTAEFVADRGQIADLT